VAWVLELVPKSGPFKSLAFRAPTPEVEKMFMASFNATVDSYRMLLAHVDAGNLALPNENIDLGTPALAGQYKGADLAYDKLLDKLAEHKFAGIPADLRSHLLDYYKDRMAPAFPVSKKASAEWAKLLEERAQLEEMQPETASASQ